MDPRTEKRGAVPVPERPVRVGTCGFAEAQARIFRDFDILEVQSTFYQPPRVLTAERWRQKAPSSFVFTLKAWQLITHRASSPTYRRLTEPLSQRQCFLAGDLRWNELTREAWVRTQEIADALGARAILVQTPVSFGPSAKNLQDLRRFCELVERRSRILVFEPRGTAWDETLLARLVEELDLVLAVDPFLRAAVGDGLRYYRLHGRPAYHYHYRYSVGDLARLGELLSPCKPHWVLFNNDSMADDARRFLASLRRDRSGGQA